MLDNNNFNPANYKTRMLSSVLILAVVIGAIAIRQIADATRFIFDILIGFMMIFGAFEIEALLKKSNKRAYIAGMGAYPILCFLALIICISYKASFLVFLFAELGLLILTFLALWLIIAGCMPDFCKKQMKEDGFEDAGKWGFVARCSTNTVLGCIYPTLLLSFMFLINHFPSFFDVSADVGFLGLVLLFATTMSADTIAMIAGRFLKTKKINMEKLGPGKTWGGFIGGILGAMVAALVVFAIFSSAGFFAEMFAQKGVNIWIFLLLGFVCGLFNMCGDVAASFMKRRAGIKDFGNMIPGHGGVMDRINGLVFNCPIVFLILNIMFGA